MTAEQAQADQARRDRANLLREFERSPFTLDNFCKLKGLNPAEASKVLDQARQELVERRKPRV